MALWYLKVSITYNMNDYEGVPVCSYHVMAEFASVQIIFGATAYDKIIKLISIFFIR